MRPIVHARFTLVNAPTPAEGKRIVRKMTKVHFAGQAKWNPATRRGDDTVTTIR